jgi:hypothetical protein
MLALTQKFAFYSMETSNINGRVFYNYVPTTEDGTQADAIPANRWARFYIMTEAEHQ